MIRVSAIALTSVLAATACTAAPEVVPFDVMPVPAMAETDGMPEIDVNGGVKSGHAAV